MLPANNVMAAVMMAIFFISFLFMIPDRLGDDSFAFYLPDS
jgi:hypothetical protein